MGYKNFNVAIYCPVANLLEIKDNLEKFEEKFKLLEKHLHIDKMYLETYRSNETIDRDSILKIKKFFEDKGIKTSGGITTTAERIGIGFDTLCYTNKKHRECIKSVVEMTASIFDEIILDDFYFTNCKCDSCIEAKGDRSWADFRLKLMKEVSDELIVGPAKRVNPKVNMIVKFPNWYEHFQETGYNLEDEPNQFDMIYTGTETRDPLYTHQHLPKYLGYFIMRYFESIKPGKNGGGWFDPFECNYSLTSYAEQLYLTVLGKAREVTLFCLGALLDSNFTMMVPVAGRAFEEMDYFAGELGNPVGVSTYIPFHSTGEDYIHNYIGMLGIPLEPRAVYPEDSKNIFLAETAAKDDNLVDKIKKSLNGGANVIITTGLLKALENKGFLNIANIKRTDKKALVQKYAVSENGLSMNQVVSADKSAVYPQLTFATNDTWQLVSGLGEDNNFPLLLAASYSKGRLYILTIPDDFGDLYHLPQEALKSIREAVNQTTEINIDCPAKVALFVYDNGTFVIENFQRHLQDVNITISRPDAKLVNLVTGKEVEGITISGRTIIKDTLFPAMYKAYKQA
jgi:hypothetical protein